MQEAYCRRGLEGWLFPRPARPCIEQTSRKMGKILSEIAEVCDSGESGRAIREGRQCESRIMAEPVGLGKGWE